MSKDCGKSRDRLMGDKARSRVTWQEPVLWHGGREPDCGLQETGGGTRLLDKAWLRREGGGDTELIVGPGWARTAVISKMEEC